MATAKPSLLKYHARLKSSTGTFFSTRIVIVMYLIEGSGLNSQNWQVLHSVHLAGKASEIDAVKICIVLN
jgi:hypothetical protein